MYPTRKHKWVVKGQDSESWIAGMDPMLKSFQASSIKENIQIPGKLCSVNDEECHHFEDIL
jgi:hypothetical protein